MTLVSQVYKYDDQINKPVYISNLEAQKWNFVSLGQILVKL